MSLKECGHHKGKRRRIFRLIFWGIVIFLFIVLLTILLIWAILRPSKPSFVLNDITVYAFNASVPNFLTSSFQVTLSSRNPNDNIGVFYDRLDAYVTYRNEQVTYRTALPPTYQGPNEATVWSPFVYGTDVPVAPFYFAGLSEDESSGNVAVTVKVDGRVRWKVGTFISGRYHLYVQCRAFIPLGPRRNGVVVGENAVKYQLFQRCSVRV